jgi:DNA-binding CsgD family transcriptional regulator
LGDPIEVLISLNDLDRAAVSLERLVERAAASPGRWATGVASRCSALLQAARGRHGEAMDSLSAAIDLQERLPMPIELGRSLLALGGLQRRAKQKRAAAATLHRAVSSFEDMGAALWADRARAELGRVGLRPAAPLELTEAELRVAQLAAAGRSNQELAAELFMSVRTAEAHLTRVYRKLGIRSRAQLARALDERASLSTRE